MSFVLFLLTLLQHSLSAKNRCAHPIGPQNTIVTLSPADEYRSNFNYGRTITTKSEVSTVIVSSIGLNEASCYIVNITLVDNQGYNFMSKLEFEYIIELLAVEEIYPIKESYNFSIPHVKSKCWCDCPGGMDYCNSGSGDCREPCVSYHLPHQTSEGCVLRLASSEMCCSVELEPAPYKGANMFTAVKLGPPKLVATLFVRVVQKARNMVTWSSIRKVDLGKAHILDDNFKVILHIPYTPKALIPERWYFGVAQGQIEGPENHILYGGSSINGLNEWDVQKLGWFKHHNSSYHFHKEQLLQAVNGEADYCGNNGMSIEIAALYVDKLPINARKISDGLKRKMTKLTREDDKGIVRLTRLQAPRVDVTLTLREENEIIMRQDGSSIWRYDAEIHQNSKNETYARITLYYAAGSVEGLFRVHPQKSHRQDKGEAFFIYMSHNLTEVEKFVTLFGTCVTEIAEICLKPYNENEYECKTVYCYKDTPVYDQYPTPMSLVLPTISLPSWTKNLNPIEWLNGLQTPLEFAIMCSFIVALIILVVLLIKFRRWVQRQRSGRHPQRMSHF